MQVNDEFERTNAKAATCCHFFPIDNLLAIDERAVAAAVVAHEYAALFPQDAAMIATYLLAVSAQIAIVCPTDEEPAALDRNLESRIPA